MKQISKNASPHLQPALHKTNKKLSRAQFVAITKSNNNLPLFTSNLKKVRKLKRLKRNYYF